MIPIFEPYLKGNEQKYLTQAIESGWISSQGDYITQFETLFATQNGMPFGVATNSCTTALHLALVALEIGPGDEVLCPNLSFIAPINMVALTGAKPILVDVEPNSWAIDPTLLDAAITDKTKAIIVVHPFGHAADMDPILTIAQHHGLLVIEDVAEAQYGCYKGKRLGTFGNMSCFSFFANKIMTTGEGGMVLSNTKELDKELRIFRDHGMSREKRYLHIVKGYNYRMTNMQAAVGLGQLEYLSTIQQLRANQKNLYKKRFIANSKITFRPVANWCEDVHWLTTISLPNAELRDPLINHLKESEIDSRPMVFPIHQALPYQEDYDKLNFPVARDISYRSLHLPSSTGLSVDNIEKICDYVLEWAEKEF
jgi:perosamine synthetase